MFNSNLTFHRWSPASSQPMPKIGWSATLDNERDAVSITSGSDSLLLFCNRGTGEALADALRAAMIESKPGSLGERARDWPPDDLDPPDYDYDSDAVVNQ